LGGGRSRGLGVVRLEIGAVYWFDSEGDPRRLLTYLQELVAGSRQPLSPEEAAALRQDWVEALVAKLTAVAPVGPRS